MLSVYFAGGAIGLSVGLACYAVFGGYVKRRFKVQPRLKSELSVNKTYRSQALTSTQQLALDLTPEEVKNFSRKLQEAAGLSGNQKLSSGLIQKFFLAFTGMLAASFSIPLDLPLRILSGGLIGFALFFVPDLGWFQKSNDRKLKVSQALPDALDQLSLLVDSGMAFQPALEVVASKTSSPLKEDLVHTLNDLKIGTSRKDAFAALALRTRSDSLRKFARAISLAETFGVSISGVLRSQARELRTSRRLKAEEKAQKVPTKVVFPLILCFLPVILGILVAPALLGLIGILDQT